MKLLGCFLVFGLEMAFAQQPNYDTSNIVLNNTGTTVSSSQSGSFTSASLVAVACAVTTALGGNPTSSLTISIDGNGPITISLYVGNASWQYALFPFFTRGGASAAGSFGDAFVIPIHAKYTSSLNVSVATTVNAGGGGGTLQCSAVRNQ